MHGQHANVEISIRSGLQLLAMSQIAKALHRVGQKKYRFSIYTQHQLPWSRMGDADCIDIDSSYHENPMDVTLGVEHHILI